MRSALPDQPKAVQLRKRSFVRGFVGGVGVHVLLAFAGTYALSEVTAVIAHTNGSANPLAAGPFEPMSAGWTATQGVRVIAGLVAGAAAAHWERPGKWAAPLALALVFVGLAAVSIPNVHLAVAVPLVLADGASVLLGALLYMRGSCGNDG
jgi:hypothetical protein